MVFLQMRLEMALVCQPMKFFKIRYFFKRRRFYFHLDFFKHEKKVSCFFSFQFYNFFVFSQLKDLQIDSLNYIWGDYYFLNSNYEKSISKYKLNEGNLSIDRFRNLAKSYIRTNNIEKAKSIYEKNYKIK